MPFSDLMGFLPVSTHFLHMRVRGRALAAPPNPLCAPGRMASRFGQAGESLLRPDLCARVHGHAGGRAAQYSHGLARHVEGEHRAPHRQNHVLRAFFQGLHPLALTRQHEVADERPVVRVWVRNRRTPRRHESGSQPPCQYLNVRSPCGLAIVLWCGMYSLKVERGGIVVAPACDK